MTGEHSGAVISIAAFAAVLLLVLAPAGPATRNAYAVAVGVPAPSWVLPGDYVEYNQTYTIGGLTASINVNETFLHASSAEMRLEGFDPRVPAGFPEPGLAGPYDTGNGPTMTIVFGNGTTSTQQGGFTTDLTAFIDQDLVAGMNATLDSVRVHALGNHTVQAWKVDEHVLYGFIAGQPGPPVNRSLLWFEKDTLMKIRASENYTDPSNHYIVSVETLEDTNIPQLRAALTGQETNSTLSTSALSSSTASGTAQSPSYPIGWAALTAVVVVTIVAVASYFARGRSPDPFAVPTGKTQARRVNLGRAPFGGRVRS